MSDVADIVPIFAAGPAGVAVWEFGKWLVLGRLKKAEKVADDVEAADRGKLDTLLELVTKMEREMALMNQQLSTHSGTVAEVKGRVDGMSANHGTRISQLEKDVVELRTLISTMRAARRRK